MAEKYLILVEISSETQLFPLTMISITCKLFHFMSHPKQLNISEYGVSWLSLP